MTAMTFLEEQLEKIKKEELERLTEIQVENTSFASKIVNDSDFDSEVTENESYFDEAFKKIDEDRLNFIQSGGKETNDIEDDIDEIETHETVETGDEQENTEPEPQIKYEEPVVEPKKISFFDRLLQIL